MGLDQRDRIVQPRLRANRSREERADKAKPFDIPKREVWEAFKKVKANQGAAGVDGQTIQAFEADLASGLYKLWNRMSSGSYHPKPVRRVTIPKPGGGERPLGIPTVADRVAQEVVKQRLERVLEPIFHDDSYGYRPGRSAIDAPCWRICSCTMRSTCGWRGTTPPSASSDMRTTSSVIAAARRKRGLCSTLDARFTACGLTLHPQKTKIVYCKDRARRGDFPVYTFDFLGYNFRPRQAVWAGGVCVHRFLPAASPKALKAIGLTIRRWRLHRWTEKGLDDLAEKYNVYIRGWINYFGCFYGSRLLRTLRRIDLLLARWARRKYRRLRPRPKGAREWVARIRRVEPTLFAHWRFAYVRRPDIGSRVNREVHARF